LDLTTPILALGKTLLATSLNAPMPFTKLKPWVVSARDVDGGSRTSPQEVSEQEVSGGK
jgi:hypothetical protein